MWCAIIVNKQMKKNHQRSVQPENLKIPRKKLFKNFHRNFNFFYSLFEAFLKDFRFLLRIAN